MKITKFYFYFAKIKRNRILKPIIRSKRMVFFEQESQTAKRNIQKMNEIYIREL